VDYTLQNDATLIRLVARAQADALSELFDRYNRLVFSVALAIIGDQATAGEITLDVFTRVWHRAGLYRADQAKVSTWLTIITRHLAIDVLRQQAARPEQHNVSWDEVAPNVLSTVHNPEEIMELSQRRARVRVAVAQLPADQKQVLALAYFKGYTHRQIAEMLDQPLGTVKTRIRLAMQKLRQMLQDEGGPPDKSKNALAAYNIVEEV